MERKTLLILVLVLAGLVFAGYILAQTLNAPKVSDVSSPEVGIGAKEQPVAPVVTNVSATVSSDESEEIEKLKDSDNDGLNDYREKELGTDPNNFDTDEDWISDKVETEIGTDPTKLDTDNDGIDDFNEYYTYPHLLNPNDPTDAEEFLAMIPNVEAKPWKLETGGDVHEWQYYSASDQRKYEYKKRMEIAKRDPLVQWYALHIQVQWYEPGIGRLAVDGDTERLRYGLDNYSDEEYTQDLNEGRSHPAYYFTHGGRGMCEIQATAFASVFELKGYEVAFFEQPGHMAIEIFKDGQSFIITNGVIMKSEDYIEYIKENQGNWTAWTATKDITPINVTALWPTPPSSTK